MATVEYRGVAVELAAGETVLAALERAGVAPPRGCRRGVCGACLLRATKGEVPSDAQRGLLGVHAASGALFACLAKPKGDLVLADLGRGIELGTARVVALDELSPDVRRVRLEPSAPVEYVAGQYVVVARADGLERSYSLASLPSDAHLELHVRRVPGGEMSGWIFTQLAVGESVTLRGPLGSCFYQPGRPEQPLLLVGAGTGLAPLIGVLRDALGQGHRGPIALYHGARDPDGLYLREELAELAAAAPNVRYVPCVLQGGGAGVREGALDEAVLADLSGTTAGQRAFLCGDAALVRALKRRFFLAGAASKDLLADPFEPASQPARSMAPAT